MNAVLISIQPMHAPDRYPERCDKCIQAEVQVPIKWNIQK